MLTEISNDGPDSEFEQILYGAERSLFRWEQQPSYYIGSEHELLQPFLDGNPPPPTQEPATRRWLEHVSAKVSEGMTIGRVRVIDEPPSDYQRWLRWTARWNRMAGETIDYLRRSQLREMGPPPVFPLRDWWLVDDEALVVIAYNAIYQPTLTVRSDDKVELFLAKQWRDEVVVAARAGS